MHRHGQDVIISLVLIYFEKELYWTLCFASTSPFFALLCLGSWYFVGPRISVYFGCPEVNFLSSVIETKIEMATGQMAVATESLIMN